MWCGSTPAAATQAIGSPVPPAASPLLTPIAMIHRFYGLAEAVSRRLGRNPDHPRNLHKVTETI